jgi:nitrous oxidase accessory protein NosD
MTRLASSLALALASTAATGARAAPAKVSTSKELLDAIAAAHPGHEILLAPGTYALAGANCSADGTAAAPITVRSETPLAAVIEFDGLEGFLVTGAHWHFEGLTVRGVCAADSDCEHAFHVVGKAEGFVLRKSRVLDFNAQLKVNAAPDGGGKYLIPHAGTVELSELADTASRDTSSPVTKLNIDTGDGWVVRGNYIRDFHKNGGDGVSYGAFMKSGGKGGLFERNLVVCEKDVAGGVRIGLSFGGGGTAPQYCAPAFDAGVPCLVEHSGGLLRNNLVVGCSDVGIYLNRAQQTRVLHNTLVATTGIDFRFDTTSGAAHANVLMGKIRPRDGATFTATDNLEDLPLDFFTKLYAAPLALDFAVVGDAASLQKGPALPDVLDDYCARARPAQDLALGALEHSLGDCAVVPPPEGTSGAGGGGGPATGAGGAAASAASGLAAASTGAGPASADGDEDADGGCGCRLAGAPPRASPIVIAVLVGSCLAARCLARRRAGQRPSDSARFTMRGVRKMMSSLRESLARRR